MKKFILFPQNIEDLKLDQIITVIFFDDIKKIDEMAEKVPYTDIYCEERKITQKQKYMMHRLRGEVSTGTNHPYRLLKITKKKFLEILFQPQIDAFTEEKLNGEVLKIKIIEDSMALLR